MSFISPILGAGQIHGNVVLRGNNEVVDFADAETQVGFELQFFSNSGELTGVIGSQYEKSSLINLEIKIKKIGELESFKFTIGRKLDIPFFDGMEVRFFYNNIHWFTGFLVVKPGQDRRDVIFEYEGKGGKDFFKRITVEKLYENKTLKFILDDLIQNELNGKTPVIFNDSLIVPPSITVTKLEFKNKTIDKCLKTILEIANVDYLTTQYRYGTNLNKEFFFEAISNDLQFGFFEGYQYQEPDVEENIDELINVIRVFRAQENSNTVKFVDEYEDADSKDTWGERIEKLIIADFVDTTTVEKIADSILQQKKDPETKIEITSLKIEDEPYPIGFYSVNNRRADYEISVSDFEDLDAWTKSIVNTTITEYTQKTISKNKSFKCDTTSGSVGEYIEIELDESIYFPNFLILYINQSVVGDKIQITIFDEDNNFETLGNNINIISQDGAFIVSQDGARIKAQQKNILVNIVDEFFRFETPILELNHIKKIRITFLTNEIMTIIFDRLDIKANIWKQNILASDEFLYIVEKANVKVNAIFGQKTANIIEDLKKIDNRQKNINDIFEKD
jgi:hypothetical protein